MYCERCGTKLSERQTFCPNCGKNAALVPLMPVQNRIQGHIRLLAIFWFAISAFHLIPGIVLLSIFGQHSYPLPVGGPPFVAELLQLIGSMFLVSTCLGVIVGAGLLARRRWGRTFAILMGSFALIDMPFGTALGIYTLWVLLPTKSEQQYRQIAAAA